MSFGRLGLMFGGGGATAFNPLTLSPTLWLDAADTTTLYQDTGTVTPATAAADPVGRWSDKSGANRHFLQATAGLRPALRITSGKNGINPDGIDDTLSTAAGQTWAASLDLFIVISNVEADTSYILFDDGAATEYLGIAVSGGGGTVSDLGGGVAPSAYVNNSAAITDRGALYTAIGTTNAKVVEFRGFDFTAGWGSLKLNGYAGFLFGGRYHEILIYPAMSSVNRTTVRDYLTTKWGVA